MRTTYDLNRELLLEPELMSTIVTFGMSVLAYLFLCAVTVSAGLGLIRLGGLKLPLPLALHLSPAVTLAFWTVMVGCLVTLGVQVRLIVLPLWILSLGAAVLGIRWLMMLRRRGDADQDGGRVDGLRLWTGWPLVVAALLPVLVFSRCFRDGLTDFPIFPESWTYAAYGQYLWHHPKYADGGVSPLYQHAAHMSTSRHASAALLGFFSPLALSPGDTLTVTGLHLAWTLFVIEASCAFLGIALGLRPALLALYLVAVGTSGWIQNLALMSNYDNALALALFPALVGGILVSRGHRAEGILWGLLGAALLYAYPELAPMVLAGASFVFIESRWRRRPMERWGHTLIAALAVTLALAAPSLVEMSVFFKRQWAGALVPAWRPATSTFDGLLAWRYQPSAFWGLGGEHRTGSSLALRNTAGFLLSALGALGLLRLLRQRRYSLAAVIAMAVAISLVMILYWSYGYGASKAIVMGWWALCLAVVMGLEVLVSGRHAAFRAAAPMMFGTLLLLAVPLHPVAGFAMTGEANLRFNVRQFRAVERVRDLVHGRALLLAVDQWLPYEAATYYLRDLRIRPAGYRGAMSLPSRADVNRAADIGLDEIRYVLTDDRFDGGLKGQGQPMVWAEGPYRLWKLRKGKWAIVGTISNANGIESLDGRHFFWLGQGTTTLEALASAAGMLRIAADIVPGPSVPGRSRFDVLVTTRDGHRRLVEMREGHNAISVPAVAGRNVISLQTLDQPSVSVSNDPRPMVLGVWNIGIGLAEAGPVIEEIENPNGLERLEERPFFWLGGGDTTLKVYSDEAGMLHAAVRFVPGPSVPGLAAPRILLRSNRGYATTLSGAAGEGTFALPIEAGETILTLQAPDPPAVRVQPNGDARPMIVGLQGLKVWLEKTGAVDEKQSDR